MPSAAEDRLSTEEQLRCLYYTGYSVLKTASTLVGGWPAAYETAQLVNQSLRELRGEACPMVREILVTLNKIDAIMKSDALDRLAAEQLGNLRLRSAKKEESEMNALWAQRKMWAKQLCDMLGVQPYQYSSIFNESGGGGSGSLNATVRF